MNDSCKTCWFWKPIGASFNDGGDLGDCRRKSPVISGNDRGRNMPAWPQTFNSDWCGEYLIKAPAEHG